MLDVLLNVLQTYLNTAQREHKEVCYRRREYWNEAVRKLIGYVDHSFVQILSAIKRITDSAEFDDAEKVRQIRALLAAEEPDLYRVEQGKGRMDRYVMLSPKLLQTLREWWRVERPKGWLFSVMQPAATSTGTP